MGLQHIGAIINEDNRRKVQHETFGHLFPESGSTFNGSIRVALSDYGDLIVLSDDSNVPSSPWWYEALTIFSDDFLMEKDTRGSVFEIQILSRVVDTSDDQETIEIQQLGYKTVLEAK